MIDFEFLFEFLYFCVPLGFILIFFIKWVEVFFEKLKLENKLEELEKINQDLKQANDDYSRML